jgi:hypothetical protein
MRFHNGEEPLQIRGSNGGLYFLYNNGQIARIDKDMPYLGRVTVSKELAPPDYLATIYVWITKRENDFVRLWGCGNITVEYSKSKKMPELREETSFQVFRPRELNFPRADSGTEPVFWAASSFSTGTLCIYSGT